jgi:heat shock protein HslJ
LTALLALAPTVALAQTEADYVVQDGDWMAKIAATQYGDWKLYPSIILATQEAAASQPAAAESGYATITDPWRLEKGWRLRLPALQDALASGLTVNKLESNGYPSEWTQSGTAQLVDGEYSETIAPGSASKVMVKLDERMAFGWTPEGQPFAAVVLYTDAGGSGTFGDLHAVVDREGQAVPTASTLLGDRVVVELLAIEEGEIVAELIAHGPDDPMCCPSQRVQVRYALQGDQLVETWREVIDGGIETQESVGTESDIVGVTWEWERFEGGDDSVIEVNDPSRYTLLLKEDGTYAVRADCNTGSGAYTLKGSSLTLEPGPMTLAACPEDSLDARFVRDLGYVRSFVTDGDRLFLNLMADAGNMVFRPAGSTQAAAD